MLKEGFAVAMRSPNAQIYLKMLRERIMGELQLSEGATLEEWSWDRTAEGTGGDPEPLRLDPEASYNFQHLNNDQAIGYRNLEERAANIDRNREMAHETVFDKMLADYFLQKRADYKKSNKLLEDIETLFATKEGRVHSYDDLVAGHPVANAQELQVESAKNTIGAHYLRQTWNKQDKPSLLPYNLPALMELDKAVNRQLHNGRSAFSNQVRGMYESMDGTENPSEIPPYFPINDVRKPADIHVKETLNNILVELFDARQRLEEYLSRGELLAYDKVMAKYLKHDVLMGKVKRELYKDYAALEQQGHIARHTAESERDRKKRSMKTRNQQPVFNRGVENEDAFYKHLAFSGMLEKTRREAPKGSLDKVEMQAGFHEFEHFY